MSNVLGIGDTHCPGMHRKYVDHLQYIRDAWNCDRVVHLGDLVDWHSISFHGRSCGTTSPEAEVHRARIQIRKLEEAFPEADWLEGNHDALPFRQLETIGMPIDVLRDPAEYWGLKKWRLTRRFGAVEIDGVRYEHGERGSQGQYPHVNQAKENMQSTVIGHLHSVCGVRYIANDKRKIFGCAVGCGIDRDHPQFAYGRKFSKKPILGCAVIIDGEAAFSEVMDL